MRRTKWFVLALAAGIAACGGGSGGANNASSNPLVVGGLFAASGHFAFVGSQESDGAKVGIYDVNHNGGVLGHQLSLVVQDTSGDAVDAVTAFHQLSTDNPVFEVGPSSLEIGSTGPLYNTSDVPDFNIAGTSSVDTVHWPYVWRVTPSDSTLTAGMAAEAVQKGLLKAVMFFTQASNSYTEVAPLTQFYTGHGGSVLDSEVLAPDQSSYRTEVTKAFSKSPNVVFFNGDPQTDATLFSNIRELGYLHDILFIGDNTGADAQVGQAIGYPVASQFETGLLGAPPTGPAYTHFLADYQTVLSSSKVNGLAPSIYDGVIIAALAMTEAHSTDPKVWNKDITKVSNPPGTPCYTYSSCISLLKAGKKINYEGAAGPEDFNQYHSTFAGWEVVQFDSTGNLRNYLTIPASTISDYLSH